LQCSVEIRTRWCIVLFHAIQTCFCCSVQEGTCALPWDGTWYDSAFPDNDVTFDSNTQSVTGWKIIAYNTEGKNWVCLEDSPTDKQLLFKYCRSFRFYLISSLIVTPLKFLCMYIYT
jgi:hypothetical protein